LVQQARPHLSYDQKNRLNMTRKTRNGDAKYQKKVWETFLNGAPND